jgi:heavy metal efflux system protein
MFNAILAFSVQKRGWILLLSLALGLLGVYSFQHLPIDAVPDITNVQVQINTEAPGYSPLETEQQITYPIEFSLAGLPTLKETRSLSRYGLSQVTVVFEEGTDIYFARQLLNQKLQSIQKALPAGVQPELGPIATGLGEIYMWTLQASPEARQPDGSRYTLTDLKTLQDWVVRPQIKTVPGVTEVNTIGGHEKTYEVNPFPEKMRAYQVSFADVVTALEKNNQNVGAGYIEESGNQALLRVPGRLNTLEDIKSVLITTRKGVPIQIKDVAQVQWGSPLRTGAATLNSEEAVLGTAVMLLGANSREVAEAVKARIESVNKTLPAGISIQTVYDRAVLVEKTIATVEENLLLGALFVIAVLFLFLGNLRAALITAMVIPLSMSFTLWGMLSAKISANLMSLGALDFGIIVDGTVVIAENCLRHLSERQRDLGRHLSLAERLEGVKFAAQEARQALLFGELIIMVVYLPILALEGVEGKMFQPMALTVILALLGATVLSITFVPAALAFFMTGQVKEKENPLVRRAKRIYNPLLKLSLRYPLSVLTFSVGLLAIAGVLATQLGQEFVPNLNEGDVAIQALRVPGTGLAQSITMQKQVEKALMARPEVLRVFSRIGTAEVATDPMPPNIADTFVMLKPRSQWPNPKLAHPQLLATLEAAIGDLPGNNYEMTQPIQMRFNELLSGVRADVAIKIYGDDLDALLNTAQQMAQKLRKVQGASDVNVEQVAGLPVLTMTPRKADLARYGVPTFAIQDLLQIAGGGKPVGQIMEGDRRFDLVLRLPASLRDSRYRLQQLPVLPEGASQRYLALSNLVDFEQAQGPNQISRENGKRRIVVTANVRGRDLGSFVEAAQRTLEEEVDLPTGYWVEWAGEFKKLQSASARLRIVVPITLGVILLLLYSTLASVPDSLLVFSSIPLALSGGVFALYLRQMPLSISAGVGFIALSGVAVLNGLVMLTFIRKVEGPLEQAIIHGAMTRLRPVLMTACVASLGFVPMALSTGTGAEVQRPLATVVIGGIASATLLTLFVLPVLYRLVHHNALKQPQRKETHLS